MSNKEKISRKLPGLVEEKCSEFISTPYSAFLSSPLDIVAIQEFLRFTLLNSELPLKNARKEFLETDCSQLYSNISRILSDLHAETYFSTDKDRSTLMLGLFNVSAMGYFLIEENESPWKFKDLLGASKESIADLSRLLREIKEEIQANLTNSTKHRVNKIKKNKGKV